MKKNDDKGLTIGQVQEYYLAQRYHGSTIASILDKISSKENNYPINNDSYVDALELTDYMFSRTKKSLKILTGLFGGEFLSALKNFPATIQRLKNQEKPAKIIIIETLTENETNRKKRKSYFSKFKDDIDIRYGYVNEDAIINHMILADDTMARHEKFHKELTKDSPAESIKADVFLNSPIINQIHTEYFDKVWEHLQ